MKSTWRSNATDGSAELAIPGPEPPDVVLTDIHDRQIGIELTEWLDERQTTASVTDQENKMKWLAALDTENHTPPQNFQAVSIWFRSRARFSPQEAAFSRQEFYELMSHVDGAWEREMADTPQKIWNDFSGYPTLHRHVHLIRFLDRMPFRPQRWAVATPKGGAYDPAGPRKLCWRESKKRNTSRTIQA